MASILDLFNKSDKNKDYTSPDKTPMSTGMGMDGTKDIDPAGTYHKDPYKFGTNYSKDADKQKGRDLTPLSVGNSENGSKAIDTSGTYYTSPYKFGTNYSTAPDSQKGKDLTPISIGRSEIGSKNIDPSGTYYKDPYKFGTNYSTAPDRQKGKDLTPFSVGRGLNGSKGIDPAGTYYTDPYKFGTNYSTEPDKQKGRDLTPMSEGKGIDGSKNIDGSGTYYKDPYKFGTNYSTAPDKQKGRDLTPFSIGLGGSSNSFALGSNNIDTKGRYYTDPYKFGTNYSTEVDKQKGKDLTPFSVGTGTGLIGVDGTGRVKNPSHIIDPKGRYYTDPYKFGTNYSTEVDKQKGKDLTPFSLGSGGATNTLILGSNGIDPEGRYYTDPYKFGTNYSTEVDKQKGRDLTPFSVGTGTGLVGVDGTGRVRNPSHIIDSKGRYYTDPYKFGTNYSTDVDKQKGKDLTPFSNGNNLGGDINVKGRYYTDPYKYGTNYSTDVDKQKGRDLTPFSLPGADGFTINTKSGNIDLKGKYYTDPYKFGIKYWAVDNRFRRGLAVIKLPKLDPNYDPGPPGSGGRRDGSYVDPITNLVDQTPFSIGTDSFGSKNIDRGGHYYKDTSYKFGIIYPKAIEKQINNEDPFQFTVAGRTMSTAGLRNGALKVAKILPKKTFKRIKNVIDQELSGLRVKHFTSVLDLYGTELIRITKQSTNLVDDMKVATGGRRRTGLLGALASPFNKVKEKIKEVIGFPETAIPTFVVEEGTKALGSGRRLFSENRGAEQNTMEYLAKIRKDAAGSIVGRFLKQNGSGTPKQIVRNTVSSLGDAAKGAIRKGLFGRGTTLETNEPNKNNSQGTIYGSADNNINIINVILSAGLPDRRYTATMEESVQKSATVSPLIITPGPSTNLAVSSGLISGIGTDFLNNVFGGENSSTNHLSWLDTTKIENKFNINRKNDRRREYLTNPDQVSSVYDGFNMTPGTKTHGHGFRTKFNKKLFEIGREEETYYDPDVQTQQARYIDSLIINIGAVRFHNAAISGLSEAVSPSWTSFRMVGSPFNAYVYESVERSVSFTIRLYALNPKQHKENWDKISTLTSYAYPAAFLGPPGAVAPHIIDLTIGDMYVEKKGFIDSLTYNIDDESTWELGRGRQEVQEYKKLFENYHYKDESYVQLGSEKSNIWKSVNDLQLLDNYKAPKLIEIQIGFKFIESRNIVDSDAFYGFKDNKIFNVPLQGFPPGTTPTAAQTKLKGSQFGSWSSPGSVPGSVPFQSRQGSFPLRER